MISGPQRTVAQAVATWWFELHPDDEQGFRGDRAAAARLRRAATTLEVMFEPEAIRLYRNICKALGRKHLSEKEAKGVAIIAGLLAVVRPPGRTRSPEDVGGEGACRRRPPLAEVLGRTADDRTPVKEDRPLLSRLRFEALIRADDPNERLRQLRRAVALARSKSFDVGRFAQDMLRWNDETRRRWIFQYYQEGRAAPISEAEGTEGTVQ